MCQLPWYEQLLPAAGDAAPPSARAPAATVATPSVVSLFISATPFSSFPGDRNRGPIRELRCGGAIGAWTALRFLRGVQGYRQLAWTSATGIPIARPAFRARAAGVRSARTA